MTVSWLSAWTDTSVSPSRTSRARTRSRPSDRSNAWSRKGFATLAHWDVPLPIAPGDAHRRDFALYRGGTIVGTVSGPDGAVEGALVQVWVGDHAQYITHRSGTTDAAGRYRIEGVRPGRALVEVGKDGLLHAGVPDPMKRWGALLDGELDERCTALVVDDDEVRLDVKLERPGGEAR